MMCDVSWQPPQPPRGWIISGELADGVRYDCRSRKLRVIVSVNREADGRPWVHFSLSHHERIPTWGEFRDAKDLFLGDVYAYQVLPPKACYVNITPRVLHLFHCLDGPQLPEFSGIVDGRRTL